MAPPATPSAVDTDPVFGVGVRALCEFGARLGDLDMRFTPAPSAQEGVAGHAAVAARRRTPYESEVPLSGQFGPLQVRGRADGYDPIVNQLEEVKTFRGDFDRIPANHRGLHWAQAKVYGWLLCQSRDLAAVTLTLVYVDVGARTTRGAKAAPMHAETAISEVHSAAMLHAFFDDLCERYLQWAHREGAHRTARNTALAGLAFPYAEFRPGQRALAEASYRAARDGRCLLAQAPTGIGKTVATLFPALKACPPRDGTSGLDKVVFLTAKTSGRQLALDSLARITAAGPQVEGNRLPLRVLELVAREKACEHPDRNCHGESCPLARGFYDRLPAARAEACKANHALDKTAVRACALRHGICPYYLQQELARWSDVIVGDVNYWFDSSALLHALAAEHEWRCTVLVDEAHNLVDRARGMYSATLEPATLAAVRLQAGRSLRRPLDRLRACWDGLHTDTSPYRVHGALPEAFIAALQHAAAAAGDHLANQPAAPGANALQRFMFDALHFGRLAESFGSHSLFDTSLDAGGDVVLCIRNVVPAPFVAPRLRTAKATVLFSATLQPQLFHRNMLGLPDDTAWVDVPSPFHSDQLQVRVARHISTRWQHRDASLGALVAAIAGQYEAAPGNYLAFFGSFDYLQKAASLLRQCHPSITTWEQSRGMPEPAREAFLQAFVAGGRGIGFAVLGGAFAEGIDLPGDRLVGAFIATLGMPQVNPVNEQMRLRMQATFGAGYDYAYFFPGLQKVVQAAGRVIRTPQDRGSVHLLDDRFDSPQARRLLPSWWPAASAALPVST